MSQGAVAASATQACSAAALSGATNAVGAPGSSMDNPLPEAVAKAGDEGREQIWNWHAQNTDIVQYHPGITAPCSGPNNLSSASEVKETVSLDLIFGLRLWPGAEFHVDGLMWQGFGFSDAHGIDGFPNGEAFGLGTDVANGSITCLFIRQTIGLGGEQETVPDDQFQLAGKRDISRVILTVGCMSARDIFDNNTYANDFFAAGGLGILAGDGALAYSWEQVLETNYDF